MFDTESEKPTDPDAARRRVDWSQLRSRVGLTVIAVLLIALVAGVLTAGVKLYLAAVADPGIPTNPIAAAAVTKRVVPPPPVMAAVRTAAGAPLNERSGPSTYDPIRGHLTNGATVTLLCQVFGQNLAGPVTTSAWWEIDSHGLYISDAYLTWSPTRPVMPWCGEDSRKPVTATAHVGVDGLSVRTGPNVNDAKVATKPNGTMLNVVCRTWGGTVAGIERTTAVWSELGTGQYVSDAYVHWSEQPYMPWCGEGPRLVPPATPAAFIAQSVAPAQADMAKYGVPASITLAQAILESGSGASMLTQVDHAVFGMKCFSDPGTVAVGCRDYATHECDSAGKCHSTSASFRVYRTETDSFTDHAILLGTTARYAPTRVYTDDPDNFAKALQKAGYATSPTYATNLISVMQKYNLYQYDRHATLPACPPIPPTSASSAPPTIRLPGTGGVTPPADLPRSLVAKPTCT